MFSMLLQLPRPSPRDWVADGAGVVVLNDLVEMFTRGGDVRGVVVGGDVRGVVVDGDVYAYDVSEGNSHLPLR